MWVFRIKPNRETMYGTRVAPTRSSSAMLFRTVISYWLLDVQSCKAVHALNIFSFLYSVFLQSYCIQPHYILMLSLFQFPVRLAQRVRFVIFSLFCFPLGILYKQVTEVGPNETEKHQEIKCKKIQPETSIDAQNTYLAEI